MKLFETSLRAFHGDASIKQKYLDRVKWHQEQDNLIQGTYSQNGKGCAVGCTLDFTSNRLSWHEAYEDQLGIPRIIAGLEDRIFENLPETESKQWPYDFLEAIPVGANLSYIWPKFAVWLLVDEQWGVINYANDSDKVIIQHIADLYQKEGTTKEEFSKAATSATASYYAAYAADCAAYAADCAAYAADAAATAAAYAAAYAHRYAAAIKVQAEKFLQLLREAPV